MFNKAVGSDEIINMFEDGKELGDILKFLDKDVNSFKDISKKYFLYD